MGYTRQRPTYKLVFEDPQYAGLEVYARSASVRRYMEIARLASYKFSYPATEEDLDRAQALFEAFSEQLESWNLEEPEGVPVKADLDGLFSLEFPFAMGIVFAWLDVVAGVALPLGQPSPIGDPSLEASMPMEVLSPNP